MVNFTGIILQSILFVLPPENTTDVIEKPAENEDSVPAKCFGEYGCYDIGDPWKTENRPVSFFPLPPEELHVRYATFSRQNMLIPYFLDPKEADKILPSKFNSAGPFIFIAHGYLEGGDKKWIQDMANALLSLPQNCNATIIAIDWREASSPPYAQAAANIRLLGVITAHMIYDMVFKLNLKNIDNFHFIGHSLGAHLGGYTGAALRTEFGLKLGRITGLDPADPFFGHVSDIVRLDRSDANYVDIVHSDASPFISGGLGISENIGHVDFFPNGGANQPGCSKGMMQYINSKEGSIFNGFRQFLGCNHLRSYEYYIESITTSCPFLAITCESFEDFTEGSCFECAKNEQHCMRFGYHSIHGYERLRKNNPKIENTSISSFIMTGDTSPFCRMTYRVTVNISTSVESSLHGGDIGRLWMVLLNKNGTRSERIPLEEHGGYHKPGTQWTLTASSKNIGVPESAQIECEYETNFLNPLTWRILMSPRIYLAWVHIESLEYKTSITICSLNDAPVIANSPSYFHQQYCKNLPQIKINTKS